MTSDPSRPSLTDARLLESLSHAFDTSADAAIDVTAVKAALGLQSDALARRIHAALDADGDGVIRREELIAAVREVVHGSARDKLQLAFRVHDEDGDGTLDRAELARMITIGLAEDRIAMDETEIARLAQRVFAEADRNGDGKISFDEFEAVVRARPGLLEQMTRSEARWIAPNEDLLARAGSRSPRRIGELLANRACVPDVARHEWHPFTISSAPESAELTIHVRSLGNWTDALRRRVEASERGGPHDPRRRSVRHAEPARLRRAPRGARRRRDRRHSLREHPREPRLAGKRQERPAVGAGEGPLLLAEPRSVLVRMVKGHPDWESALRTIRDAHAPARVDVFFCGPRGVGQKIRRVASRLEMGYREERF